MITRTHFLAVILAGCCGFGPLTAQSPAGTLADNSFIRTQSVFDEIHRDDVLGMVLETDLSALMDNRFNTDFQLARLTYPVPGRGNVTREVELGLRGKFRRRICAFPPLKLEFTEPNLLAAGLNPSYHTLKLVTHCLEDEKDANENLLREYLIYRLYGLLTEKSYRAQLVRITYRDTGGNREPMERYGFLLEDTDELAHRLGGKECDDCRNPPLQDFSAKDATLLALFQFMVGNADWNILVLRNLKYVKRQDQNILVPYDFDFAGLVNASYAIPNPDYPLREIRDRIYLGYPAADVYFKWGLNYLKFKKNEIMDFVAGFDYLSRGSREDIRRYLDFFFAYVDTLKVNDSSDLYEELSRQPLYYVPQK